MSLYVWEDRNWILRSATSVAVPQLFIDLGVSLVIARLGMIIFRVVATSDWRRGKASLCVANETNFCQVRIGHVRDDILYPSTFRSATNQEK